MGCEYERWLVINGVNWMSPRASELKKEKKKKYNTFFCQLWWVCWQGLSILSTCFFHSSSALTSLTAPSVRDSVDDYSNQQCLIQRILHYILAVISTALKWSGRPRFFIYQALVPANAQVRLIRRTLAAKAIFLLFWNMKFYGLVSFSLTRAAVSHTF